MGCESLWGGGGGRLCEWQSGGARLTMRCESLGEGAAGYVVNGSLGEPGWLWDVRACEGRGWGQAMWMAVWGSPADYEMWEPVRGGWGQAMWMAVWGSPTDYEMWEPGGRSGRLCREWQSGEPSRLWDVRAWRGGGGRLCEWQSGGARLTIRCESLGKGAAGYVVNGSLGSQADYEMWEPVRGGGGGRLCEWQSWGARLTIRCESLWGGGRLCEWQSGGARLTIRCESLGKGAAGYVVNGSLGEPDWLWDVRACEGGGGQAMWMAVWGSPADYKMWEPGERSGRLCREWQSWGARLTMGCESLWGGGGGGRLCEWQSGGARLTIRCESLGKGAAGYVVNGSLGEPGWLWDVRACEGGAGYVNGSLGEPDWL